MNSAVRIPSAAADMIPPAYPAPSPHGNNPFTALCPDSSRTIRTGEELLLSTAIKTASGSSKP